MPTVQAVIPTIFITILQNLIVLDAMVDMIIKLSAGTFGVQKINNFLRGIFFQ